jgi:hypothetical protein
MCLKSPVLSAVTCGISYRSVRRTLERQATAPRRAPDARSSLAASHRAKRHGVSNAGIGQPRPESLRRRRRVHPRPLEEPGCRVRSRSAPLPRFSSGSCTDARRHRGVAQGHSAIAAGSRRRARGVRGGVDAVALGRPDGLELRGSEITMVTNGERGLAMGRMSQPSRVAHLGLDCAPSLDIHAEPWMQTYPLGRTVRFSVRTPRWKSADSHSTAHLSAELRAQFSDVALERDAAARLIKESIRS